MAALPETSRDHHRPSDIPYSATDGLVRIEAAMTRYNRWIIGKVIKGYGKTLDSKTRVLDFGAGLGTLSQIFYEKSGVRPDALEIDPGHRLEAARRGFATYSTLAELPVVYDLVFVSNVLEHIEDDVGTLLSLKTHLKDDGALLIYVPAFEAIWTSMDEKVGHIRRYRKKALAEKLRHAGYDVRYIGYCDSLGFILAFLFKFIGSREGDLPMKSLSLYDRFLLPISRTMDVLFSRLFGKNLFVIARKS